MFLSWEHLLRRESVTGSPGIVAIQNKDCGLEFRVAERFPKVIKKFIVSRICGDSAHGFLEARIRVFQGQRVAFLGRAHD